MFYRISVHGISLLPAAARSITSRETWLIASRARSAQIGLTQREAARMLGLTSRQVRRLHRRYERDGPGGLRPHSALGKRPPREFAEQAA